MAEKQSTGDIYAQDSIFRILFKIAPPVMFASLIQSMYNLVDSFFVGRFSEHGLTALSVIFPLQLMVSGIAIGAGTGVNILMAHYYGVGKPDKARETAGSGIAFSVVCWAVFAVLAALFLDPFVRASASSPEAVRFGLSYGYIVCIGSIGLFTESTFTKILQAGGDMKRPMAAQVAGALINIVFDPLLIFGLYGLPGMGVAGAAAASVIGQIAAALITGSKAFTMPPALKKCRYWTGRILKLGYPAIIMQCLYTVYISALNIILMHFSDEAVTVLGLYYRLQTFFFIPFFAFETCVVPVISYNFAQKKYDRCRKTFFEATIISMAFMTVGTLAFAFLQDPLIRIFTDSALVLEIGRKAFPLIGLSFIPAVTSWLFPIFFQAIGRDIASSFLSIFRQLICLVPLFWLFSRISLDLSWVAFPVTEVLVTIVGGIMYLRQVRRWNKETEAAGN